jgi:monovalent cation/proton antiporter MnhG/PhaG subunit
MGGTLLEVVGSALLGLGLLLATIGLYGMLRMPGIFEQLHAAGMITGPAVVLVLLAAIGSGSAEIITSAVLVLLFVLVTSPLSSHAIAQAARRRPEGDEPD